MTNFVENFMDNYLLAKIVIFDENVTSPDCSDILFCDIERSRNMNKKDIAKSGTAFSKNHKFCCSLNYPDFALRSHPFKERE